MHLRFTPGEPLVERELSDRLGISRTPVREALLLLEREGWIVGGERKGFVVADIDARDVVEVSSLRRANEGLAIHLALPQMTDDDLAHLDELLTCQERAVGGPPQQFIHIDQQFHGFLASLSQNRRLAALLQNLSDHMVRMGIAAVTQPGRDLATLAEHRKVFDAITRRDAAAATMAMVGHLDNTQVTILTSLAAIRKEGISHR